MVLEFEGSFGGGSDFGGGGWDFGGGSAGGDDIGRQYGFARDVNTFLSAGNPADGGDGSNGGAGTPSEGGSQQDNRDFFNKWKGLPTETPEERARARVECAEDKLNFNPEDYKPEKYGFNSTHWKCNEFVSDVHREGDQDGYRYPTRPNDGGWLWWLTGHGPLDAPTVADLANPEFAKNSLDYFEDGNQLKPGDIVVWHNPDRKIHHSAIYAGNGEVIQAGSAGVGRRKLEEVTNNQKGITPVYRRAR